MAQQINQRHRKEKHNMPKKTVAKSAISGRFVKKSYAAKHPKTTFKQRVRTGGKKRR